MSLILTTKNKGKNSDFHEKFHVAHKVTPYSIVVILSKVGMFLFSKTYDRYAGEEEPDAEKKLRKHQETHGSNNRK